MVNASTQTDMAQGAEKIEIDKKSKPSPENIRKSSTEAAEAQKDKLDGILETIRGANAEAPENKADVDSRTKSGKKARVTFADTPVGVAKDTPGVINTCTGTTKPEFLNDAYDELRLMVRPRLYRNCGGEIIFVYGGIATERTALVEKTIESLRKLEKNVIRINAREMKDKDIYRHWYKLFIGESVKNEGVAFNELENFFSMYERKRLRNFEIGMAHSDWGGEDKRDWFEELENPHVLFIDGIESLDNYQWE